MVFPKHLETGGAFRVIASLQHIRQRIDHPVGNISIIHFYVPTSFPCPTVIPHPSSHFKYRQDAICLVLHSHITGFGFRPLLPAPKATIRGPKARPAIPTLTVYRCTVTCAATFAACAFVCAIPADPLCEVSSPVDSVALLRNRTTDTPEFLT